VLDLARQLIGFDTINPPGNESAATHWIGDLLGAGFDCRYHEFAPNRASLLASLPGIGAPLAFTGHVDTVPLGAEPWSRHPFGEVDGDRLYGRGASDMKGAVAAIVAMALRHAAMPAPRTGLLLLITSGEETTCQGAAHLAETVDLRGMAGALVVGEPTSNRPVIAHKGCARYRVATHGVAAHASMPEHGVNAIHKLADIIGALRRFEFGVAPHPILGGPTLNIGTIRGGSAINIVADAAEIGVDIRLVPGQPEARVRQQLQELVGSEGRVELLEQAASVATEPDHPWVVDAVRRVSARFGESLTAGGVPYFTDASVLTAALGGVPTLILGPGEASMAHKVDEYCRISLLEQSVEIYAELARSWNPTEYLSA
jgi:succinyl-diaminopimelate desuccinylase